MMENLCPLSHFFLHSALANCVPPACVGAPMSSKFELPPEIANISVKALRRDDPAEWEKAFPWLWDVAKKGARSNRHPFPEQDIEDFAKDAILQVRKNLQEGKICHPDGEFRELLGITYVTAWRRSVQAFRTLARRKTELKGEPIEPEPSQPFAPIPVSHTDDRLERVLSALNELTPPQPDIYLAIRLHGQSPDDVARAYNKTYDNVNQIVCRVTKWLRDWFKREGGTPA